MTGWSGYRIAGWRGRAVLTLLALLAAVMVAGCGGTKTVTDTVTVTVTGGTLLPAEPITIPPAARAPWSTGISQVCCRLLGSLSRLAIPLRSPVTE